MFKMIYEYGYFETLSCEDKTLFWYIYAIYTCKSYPKHSKNIRKSIPDKILHRSYAPVFSFIFFSSKKIFLKNKK